MDEYIVQDSLGGIAEYMYLHGKFAAIFGMQLKCRSDVIAYCMCHVISNFADYLWKIFDKRRVSFIHVGEYERHTKEGVTDCIFANVNYAGVYGYANIVGNKLFHGLVPYGFTRRYRRESYSISFVWEYVPETPNLANSKFSYGV